MMIKTIQIGYRLNCCSHPLLLTRKVPPSVNCSKSHVEKNSMIFNQLSGKCSKSSEITGMMAWKIIKVGRVGAALHTSLQRYTLPALVPVEDVSTVGSKRYSPMNTPCLWRSMSS